MPGDLETTVAPGRQGAAGAAQLQLQERRAEMGQSGTMASKRRQPAGRLQTEGCWHRLLATGSGRHHRMAMQLSQIFKLFDQTIEAPIEQVQELAMAECLGAVENVLGGRSPMHIVRIFRCQRRLQRPHQGQYRHAGFGCRGSKVTGRDVQAPRRRGDARGRLARNDAGRRQGFGQGRFHFQHVADLPRFRHELADFPVAHQILKDLVIEQGYRHGPSLAPNSRSHHSP